MKQRSTANMVTTQTIPDTSTASDIGSFSGINNRLGVNNDKDALALFLRRAERRSDETLRRYTRELVRFTAFSRKEMNKGYAQITLADVEIYVDFIQAPWTLWQQPGINLDNPDKVYFPKAIKPGKSTDQIIAVLNSFFNYLHTTGYSAGNPFSAFDKSGEKHARGHGELRYFFKDEWSIVLNCIHEYPENTERQAQEKARIHYIFSLAYGAALRESELAKHSCEDIRPDKSNEMTLYIYGKGRRLRQLPVTPDMLRAINNYRKFHDAGSFASDGFPLAPQLQPVKYDAHANLSYKSISARQIRKWFSQFMQHCAGSISHENPELAERLLQKSFHSLRHTALSHLAQRMDIEDLSIFAGHESITTTQQYYTPERQRLRELTQQHRLAGHAD